MSLDSEIEEISKSVRTDAYQMSIGEVLNMYSDGELIINPDFQRLYRWGPGQKSSLVESILLDIPIPSIFVYEKDDGNWELVDGLQRISTLLEFVGSLKNPDDGTQIKPLVLVATKYLPSLDGVTWADADKSGKGIGKQLQLAIRRSRLNVEILKRSTDSSTKFELFQRLNAGGSVANPQELRNCMMIMFDASFYSMLKDLAENPNFSVVLRHNLKQIEQQKPMEYVTRFMVHVFVEYNSKLDVEEFLDYGIRILVEKKADNLKRIFEETFKLLNNVAGENVLRRFDEGIYKGKRSLAIFEVVAIGVGRNIDRIIAEMNPAEFVRKRIASLWANTDELEAIFALGMRGTTRLQKTLTLGQRWFKP